MLKRKPDFIIGEAENPYMLRWWIIPRNRLFNVYLHKILRSDDDRALHDHPWWNLSVVFKGGYYEVMPFVNGIRGYMSADLPYDQLRRWRGPGRIVGRRATAAHRLELAVQKYNGIGVPPTYRPCWSLFITGPKLREWGFLCQSGWRHWKDFVAITPGGNEVGKGCGD